MHRRMRDSGIPCRRSSPINCNSITSRTDTGVRVCHNLREFESAVEEALGSPAGRAAINSALTAEAMAALR